MLLRILSFLIFLICSYSTFADPSTVEFVDTSKPFFNPTLNEKLQLTVRIKDAGFLNLIVLDRDGYPVATLAKEEKIETGEHSFSWNGQFSLEYGGGIVPDEAYSFYAELSVDNDTFKYFPAEVEQKHFSISEYDYSVSAGTISFVLPAAARVHIQAGCTYRDPKTNEVSGPVMRTISNRTPRAAGKVIEYWSGFDESETIQIRSLPNASLAIAAWPLPQNSVITVGNRDLNFLKYAAELRKGYSLLKPVAGDHSHHAGLQAIQDVSPELTITPTTGAWDKNKNLLTLGGARSIKARIGLSGYSAKAFAKQPAVLHVYLDGKLVQSITPQGTNIPLSISAATIKDTGEHLLAINWASQYGGTAHDTIRIQGHQEQGKRGIQK